MNIRNFVIAVSIIVIQFSSAFFVGFAALHSPKDADPSPFSTACAEEDSNGCYWDAGKFGNKLGSSFIVTDSGQVFRFDPKYSTYPNDAFHK